MKIDDLLNSAPEYVAEALRGSFLEHMPAEYREAHARRFAPVLHLGFAAEQDVQRQARQRTAMQIIGRHDYGDHPHVTFPEPVRIETAVPASVVRGPVPVVVATSAHAYGDEGEALAQRLGATEPGTPG